MGEFKKVMLEGSIALTAALLIEMFAGGMLQSKAEALKSLAIILLFIPPVDNWTGTLGAVVVARLSTALQLGTVEPWMKGEELRDNLLGIAIVSLITMGYLVALGLGLSTFVGVPVPDPFKVSLMVLCSCALSSTLSILTSLFLSMLAFKMGMDPNLAALPIVTALGDVYGISSLLVFSFVFGFI